MINLHEITENDIRFYVGYAGWDASQLDREISEKSWILSHTTVSEVIHPDPQTLWRSHLKNMGKDYALWANFPTILPLTNTPNPCFMIRHLVMFKLRDYNSPEEKKNASVELRNELMSLKRKYRNRWIWSRINVSGDDAAFDLVINSVFASREDLKSYQLHPYHRHL